MNKIILIAAYSATGIATDVHKSPYGDLYGIEHHANALNTILNQDFILKLTEWQNIFILLIIALLFGLLIPRFSIVISILFTSLFAIGFIIAGYVMFDIFNFICAFSTPLLQVGVTFTAITTYSPKASTTICDRSLNFISDSACSMPSLNDIVHEGHSLAMNSAPVFLASSIRRPETLTDIIGLVPLSRPPPPQHLAFSLVCFISLT